MFQKGALLAAVLATTVGCVGCGGSETVFATKYAPDLRREGTTVSVFGVFKDGRMNSDAWNELAPRFAVALGGTACESLYGDVLLVNDRAVASAVDDQARSEGVTEELLDVFVPGATGEAILILIVAGSPPKAVPSSSGKTAQATPAMSTGRGGGRRGGGGRGGSTARGPSAHENHDAFEVSAELYSVREHHALGVVAMTYTGTSVDEAVASFVAKLHAELPATKCVGWKPDVRFEADKVRAARPKE